MMAGDVNSAKVILEFVIQHDIVAKIKSNKQ